MDNIADEQDKRSFRGCYRMDPVAHAKMFWSVVARSNTGSLGDTSICTDHPGTTVVNNPTVYYLASLLITCRFYVDKRVVPRQEKSLL